MSDFADKQYDEETLHEVIAAYDAFSALGILANPDSFRTACQSYDSMLGRNPSLCPAASEMINDETRSWYAYLTAYLLRLTKLDMDELSRVLVGAAGYVKENKRAPMTIPNMYNLILAFCAHIDFEPRWHMRRRGDDRPLPSSKNKNLWRYLRDIYIDPECSRLRMPDAIKRAAPMYKGYEECVKRAVADGHAELKRIYGDDVDLSPVTERRDKEDDFDGASFMSLLSRGSPFARE